jgi:hypothetical protein
MTSNLYAQWVRAMLGEQQRLAVEFLQAAQAERAAGRTVVPPEDTLARYREALSSILPHLQFVELDMQRRELVYDSAGHRVGYHELSTGEKELAFLVGQVERFGVRDGIFLLDEPELHLNAELLRRWTEYLRGTVRHGQVWLATHSLEVAEVAGAAATIVLERGADRSVRRAVPIGERPVLATLCRAVGTPAFSLLDRRFVFVEGRVELGESERVRRLLDTGTSVHFLESGSCGEVLSRLRGVSGVASAAEQLRVGAIIDRDHRSERQAAAVEAEGVFVLPVHELENAFLQPAMLTAILAQAGRDREGVTELLRRATDPIAGVWILQRAAMRHEWEDVPAALRRAAMPFSRDDVLGDRDAFLEAVLQSQPLDEADTARRHRHLVEAASAYEAARENIDELWRVCSGKEAIRNVARDLGFRGLAALEARAFAAWDAGEVPRPDFVPAARRYIDELALAGA